MRKVFPSAVDLWLALLLASAPLMMLGMGLWQWQHGDRQGIFLLAGGCLVGGLILLFARPCVYTLTDETLYVRCGVFTTAIPLERIARVEPSGSWLSAPALSLRRVRITHAGGAVLVSPRGREAFIAELRDAVARRQKRR